MSSPTSRMGLRGLVERAEPAMDRSRDSVVEGIGAQEACPQLIKHGRWFFRMIFLQHHFPLSFDKWASCPLTFGLFKWVWDGMGQHWVPQELDELDWSSY